MEETGDVELRIINRGLRGVVFIWRGYSKLQCVTVLR